MCERFVGSAFFQLILAFTQGVDVGALIPQGLSGNPNYCGFLNNLVTLINCESLKEIVEMACVTPTRSLRGQTHNSNRKFLTLMHVMPARNSLSYQLSGS